LQKKTPFWKFCFPHAKFQNPRTTLRQLLCEKLHRQKKVEKKRR
jgi:hypothetical protein